MKNDNQKIFDKGIRSIKEKGFRITLVLFLVSFIFQGQQNPSFSMILDEEIEKRFSSIGKSRLEARREASMAKDHILVKFKSLGGTRGEDLRSIPSVDTLGRKHGVRQFNMLERKGKQHPRKKAMGLDRVHRVDFEHPKSKGEILQAVADFRNNPNVEYAEPDYVVKVMAAANDSRFPEQWGLDNTGQFIGGYPSAVDADIDAPEAWDLSVGSSAIILAILDTGVDLNHPDLSGKLVAGYDFVNDDSDPQDDFGHGTHVAGIAGAVTNNGVGVAGVCRECSLMPVKVLDDTGSGLDSWVANGVIWATDNGAKVINLSLGGPNDSTVLHEAVRYAYDQGVVVVSSRGNSFMAEPSFPAFYSEVISVGASGSIPGGTTGSPVIDDTRASFSSYKNHIDVVAPGIAILSAVPTSGPISDPTGFVFLSGTSMAAPHVTGLAGLLLSMNSSLSANQVKSIVNRTADDQVGDPDEDQVGWDSYMGWGRINAISALQSGFSPPADPPYLDTTRTEIRVNAPKSSSCSTTLDLPLTSRGTGLYNWTISLPVTPWLTIDPISGEGNSFLTITFNASGLEVGEYHTTLTVTSPEAINTLDLPITFTVISDFVHQGCGTAVVDNTGDQFPIGTINDGAGGQILVWDDWPNGLFQGESDLYAQRFDANGQPLWSSERVPISLAPGYQYGGRVISDNQGGAIIVWLDNRSGNFEIYAQRINSNGQIHWDVNGKQVGSLILSGLIEDGQGGAFMTVEGGGLYIQRINSNGGPVFPGNGILMTTSFVRSNHYPLISDGTGGVITVWYTGLYGEGNVVLQRINSSGQLLWGASGVTATETSYQGQESPALISDGLGGGIVVWEDYRNNPDPFSFNKSNFGGQLHAQRFNASGQRLWNNGGVPLTTHPTGQYGASIISDGERGGIVFWSDTRNSPSLGTLSLWDTFGQRISSTGQVLWDPEGVYIGQTPNSFAFTYSDGMGGAILFWEDFNFFSIGSDLTAQRVDKNGNLLWGKLAGLSLRKTPNIYQRPSNAVIENNSFMMNAIETPNSDRDIFQQKASFNIDTDEDGLPDWWENLYGLDPLDPLSSAEDLDGDGYDNLQEFLGGSDPQDPFNVPSNENLISNALGDQQTQSVAWNPVENEYFVVWHDQANSDIRGARLNQNGGVIASELPIAVDTQRQAGPWVAYGGGGYMAVWVQGRGSDPTGTDVYGAWILQDGTVENTFVVTNKSANQRAASVVYDPVNNRFLVTWIDDEKGPSDRDIYRAVLLPGGGEYSGPAALITANSDQRGPYARYDYGNSLYFLVWSDNGSGVFDVMGSRVNANGNLLNPGGIIISAASGHQKNPRITDRRPADGINHFTLAWIDFRNGQPDIYGTLIDENGAPMTADFEIAGGPSNQRAATVDVDYVRTKGALVSWIDDVNGTDVDIYRAQVDQTGNVSLPTLVVGQGTGAGNDQRGPLVTYSADGATDNGFLVTWRDNRGGVNNDLYGIKMFP